MEPSSHKNSWWLLYFQFSLNFTIVYRYFLEATVHTFAFSLTSSCAVGPALCHPMMHPFACLQNRCIQKLYIWLTFLQTSEWTGTSWKWRYSGLLKSLMMHKQFSNLQQSKISNHLPISPRGGWSLQKRQIQQIKYKDLNYFIDCENCSRCKTMIDLSISVVGYMLRPFSSLDPFNSWLRSEGGSLWGVWLFCADFSHFLSC